VDDELQERVRFYFNDYEANGTFIPSERPSDNNMDSKACISFNGHKFRNTNIPK